MQQLVHLTILTCFGGFFTFPYLLTPPLFLKSPHVLFLGLPSSGISSSHPLSLSLSLFALPYPSTFVLPLYRHIHSLIHSIKLFLMTNQPRAHHLTLNHYAYLFSLTSNETSQFHPYFSLTQLTSLFNQLSRFPRELILFLFLLQHLTIYPPSIHRIRCGCPPPPLATPKRQHLGAVIRQPPSIPSTHGRSAKSRPRPSSRIPHPASILVPCEVGRRCHPPTNSTHHLLPSCTFPNMPNIIIIILHRNPKPTIPALPPTQRPTPHPPKSLLMVYLCSLCIQPPTTSSTAKSHPLICRSVHHLLVQSQNPLVLTYLASRIPHTYTPDPPSSLRSSESSSLPPSPHSKL